MAPGWTGPGRDTGLTVTCELGFESLSELPVPPAVTGFRVTHWQAGPGRSVMLFSGSPGCPSRHEQARSQ